MEIDTWLRQQSEELRFGGAALVRHGDDILLTAGYGNADRAENRPNSPVTRFQIASISKQFTAAAILLLQERHRLTVRDRLSEWLPGCPAAWKSITIHNLLTHTSGICHWDDLPNLSLYERMELCDLVSIFEAAPLKFEPNTGWSYSSPGYVLLAYIVQRVADVPYRDFLNDNIFQRLGMNRTAAGNQPEQRDSQATGYDGENRAPSFELDTVGMGAGDIWSNVEDMDRWDRGLTGGELLGPESLSTMFQPHADTGEAHRDFKGGRYGYGWSIATASGRNTVFHSGGNSGFISINVLLPEEESNFILLSNDEQSDLAGATTRILSELTQY